MVENKMAEVAQMFGRRIGEHFTVKRDNDRLTCCFTKYGLETFDAYENPYMRFDVFILEELLTYYEIQRR